MHAKFLLAHFWAAVSWFRAAAILGFALYGALAIITTTAQAEETASVVQAAPVPGFMALILPFKAKAFKAASETIRAGVLAAERVHGSAEIPIVRFYPTDGKEENVVATYRQAVEDGAQLVIGPLIKSSVNYLADSTELTVPVLALNNFDDTTLVQPNLYSFSLSVEAEAAQAAALMQVNQLSHPVVLQANDILSQRMAQGFVQEWKKINQTDVLVITVADARRDAEELRQQLKLENADAVFLAMDGKAARLVHPYLTNDYPVYGTSQMDSGRLSRTGLVDLVGIHYVDMPWFGMPETDGYELYRRTRAKSNDLERLFAFGVDAWRVAAQIITNPQAEQPISGVTGVLTLDSDHVVKRGMIVRTMSLDK